MTRVYIYSFNVTCRSQRPQHTCPEQRKRELSAPLTAASRSADWNTMNGALPPSSSDMRLTVLAERASSHLPVAVLPVNEIFCTSGLSHSAWPTSGARARDAVTTLITPRGMPACSANCATHMMGAQGEAFALGRTTGVSTGRRNLVSAINSSRMLFLPLQKWQIHFGLIGFGLIIF